MMIVVGFNKMLSYKFAFITSVVAFMIAICVILLFKAYNVENNIIIHSDDVFNKNFNKVPKPNVYLPLHISIIKPAQIVKINEGHYFVDFGRVAFGTLQLTSLIGNNIEIILGERKSGKLLVYQPKNSWENVAYHKEKIVINSETSILKLPRRYRPNAEELPNGLTGVMPFRYVEIIGAREDISSNNISQMMVHYPFNDESSQFSSSSKVLNDIWELGKYTIKATSYSGIYVDGNRERKPYEADAYINQLGHYAIDNSYGLARYTQLYLLENPTWPTEWNMHSIFMAYLDYMYTGDIEYIKSIYIKLQSKLMLEMADKDGLLNANSCLKNASCKTLDVIDWPPNERDGFNSIPVNKLEFFKKTIEYEVRYWRAIFVSLFGFKNAAYYYNEEAQRVNKSRYVMPTKNTVINSFHYASLTKMAELAHFIGKNNDALLYEKQAKKVKYSIEKSFLNEKKCLFVDGEGTNHYSLHANMFPLAFGLVPTQCQEKVVSFIKKKGMACSVYGAQYLLEGLFRINRGDLALSFLESRSQRSWAHMVYDEDSTITLESWDASINPGMDWNHAWGSAPVNLIPRFVMGVRPLEPEFKSFIVMPQLGSLSFAKSRIPIKYGAIDLSITRDAINHINLELNVPEKSIASIYIPKLSENIRSLTLDNRKVIGDDIEGFIYIGKVGSGRHIVSATFLNN